MRQHRHAATLLPLSLLALTGCHGNTVQQHGLELLINSDLPTPSSFDAISLRIFEQQADGGGFGSPIVDTVIPTEGDLTLPATYAITAGKTASPVVLIQVAALVNHATPIILREVEVEVPSNEIAELPLILSSQCLGQLAVDDGGLTDPFCPSGESCQPGSGKCGTNDVDAGALSLYSEGDVADAGPLVADAHIPLGDASRDADADALIADAAADTTVSDGAPKTDAAHDATASDASHDASHDGSDAGDATIRPVDSGVDCGEDANVSYCPGLGCVDLSTMSNCGSCGVDCTAPTGGTTTCASTSPGWACNPACPGSLTDCNGTCVDEQTDNSNCGGCSLTCSACASGECTVGIVPGQGDALGIAVDSTSVYWVRSTDNTVLKANLDGTSVSTLATGQLGAAMIAVDMSHVYWTATGLGDGGVVMVAGLDGTSPATLASNQNAPWGIAVDSTNVYWVNNTNPGTVMTVLTDGGGLATLASSQDSPQGVATQGGTVYWTNAGNGSAPTTIAKVQNDGSGLATIATGLMTPQFLALDPQSVYWTGGGDGTVVSTPLDGGAHTTLASGQTGAWGIAVYGSTVYWTTWGDGGSTATTGTVVKANNDGSGIFTVAGGQQAPYGIAADGTSVYWTDDAPDGGLAKQTPN